MKWLVICLLASCGSGSTPKTPDGATGSGSACTGAVFDPCTDNSQCTSMNCHNYTSSALQICTQACTANDNTTCPMDISGNHATCNNMGLCKPAAANNCTR